MFEWIRELMEATGCDWETAAREYDAMHNPDYNADDYDGTNTITVTIGEHGDVRRVYTVPNM